MSQERQFQHSPLERTPGYRSGGLLFNLPLLPPLAVIVVSILMAYILSQVVIAAPDPQPKKKGPHISALFTQEVQYWEHKILAWSDDWNLDPNLIATVMQIESCGNPTARSSVGAMGLFQVMPFHFDANENPYKPNINARRGLGYLKTVLDTRGGEPRLALAGYNGGITGTKMPESLWPSETQRYVYWGTGIYSDALNGKTSSGRLDEWLNAGGASLCNQAAENLSLP